jgi:Probable zinc-ribbon domain
MAIFQDQTRTCVECGRGYIWSERDQKFANERGYLPPKRCPACRELMKQRASRLRFEDDSRSESG